ncbi:MAG: LptF/LptG family permease [Deltaproteobacteria bacterium]|nr:LptF/LptG family permease [Deltaproteobacteria bacterium]
MDRYIAQELTLPFLFGVGAFSSIGISIGALFELIRRMTESGLSITLAAKIFLFKLPEFIVLALPMSTLLATMMTYSRFSSDSELIALQGAGVSIRRMVAPAIVLSLMMTGLTFFFNEMVTPTANYRAAITLERALNTARPPFQEHNIFYQEFQPSADNPNARKLKRQIYAQRFDGTTMYGLTILDFSQPGLNLVVSAESATWDFSKNHWNFNSGTIYSVAPDGSLRGIATFQTQELQLPRTPFDLARRNKKDTEMSIAEATRQLDLIRQGGDEKMIRLWEIRIHQKGALPFVCVVFGLVGSSLGVLAHRTSRATSFGISVVIIFGYYLLSFITNAMGEVGILSPVMAAWLPTLLGLSAGSYLLFKANR